MTKKSLKALGAVAIVVSLGLAGCSSTSGSGGSPSSSSGAKSYVLGGTLPITGEAASIGLETEAAAELAASEAEKNGGPKITFNWQDSQLNNQTAVTALQKLHDAGVNIVLTGGSGVIVAQSKVADQNKTTLVNNMAQSPLLNNLSTNLFNFIPTADEELSTVADMAVKTRGYKKIATLTVDSDLGSGDVTSLTKDVEALGGKVVASETFPVGATDMRTALTRLRAVNPQALYIVGNTDEIGYAIAQAKELGLKAQLLGRTQDINPVVLTAAGPAANGMIGAATIFSPSASNKVGTAFAAAYLKKTGKAADVYAAIAYDQTSIVIDALKHVGGSSAAVQKYLKGVKNYPGAMGSISINSSNTATYGLFKYVVKDGKVVAFTK